MFKKWLAQVENETSLKLKYLKSVNGGEYRDNRFEEFCGNYRIKIVKKASKNPHQNRVVECMNMTIIECARSMWDTYRIAQAILGRCSQQDDVSDQQRTFVLSEL